MDASEIKPTDAFLRLKVNDLKEICLAGGLARSGRKADLQQRILTAAKHAGRVQQALERLLPNSMPFAHAAPPTPHHHGGASGSAIGRPLMPTGAVGGVGTGELRCPCGSHGRCNPQDPSARLVRCVACSSYLHCVCLGLHAPPRDFVCERCRSEQLDPFHPAASTAAPAGSAARHEGPWSCLVRPTGVHAQLRLALSSETLRALAQPAPSLLLVVRCFLPSGRLHRWPLRVQATLNGLPQHVHHVPPSWDGVNYKDRNLDQPLVLPGCGLRPGNNVLTLSGCDSRVHCAVAQLVVPTSVEHVQEAVERDGTLGFDECRERMLATFGSPASRAIVASSCFFAALSSAAF